MSVTAHLIFNTEERDSHEDVDRQSRIVYVPNEFKRKIQSQLKEMESVPL
jgi:hypothetical protein